MQDIDWNPIYKQYKGKWVALQEDEVTVIASGETLQAAYDEAIKAGFSKPIMANMPDNLYPRI